MSLIKKYSKSLIIVGLTTFGVFFTHNFILKRSITLNTLHFYYSLENIHIDLNINSVVVDFQSQADNLSTIKLKFAPGHKNTGRTKFKIRQKDQEKWLIENNFEYTQVGSNQVITIPFNPIKDSANKDYHLELELLDKKIPIRSMLDDKYPVITAVHNTPGSRLSKLNNLHYQEFFTNIFVFFLPLFVYLFSLSPKTKYHLPTGIIILSVLVSITTIKISASHDIIFLVVSSTWFFVINRYKLHQRSFLFPLFLLALSLILLISKNSFQAAISFAWTYLLLLTATLQKILTLIKK